MIERLFTVGLPAEYHGVLVLLFENYDGLLRQKPD